MLHCSVPVTKSFLLEMNARQAGTFYLVIYHVLLLASSPSLRWYEVPLCAVPLLTQKITTTEDEWSAKKRQVLMLSKQLVWIVWELRRCSLERLCFCSMFSWCCGLTMGIGHMGIGALGSDCAEWRQFHTSVPHRTWASCLSVSGLVSRRSVFWFSGGYANKILSRELTA